MNELPAVKKPPVFKRNLIAKVQFLTELCYCMNSADSIAQITEKVDDTIQQAKSLLAPTDGRLYARLIYVHSNTLSYFFSSFIQCIWHSLLSLF